MPTNGTMMKRLLTALGAAVMCAALVLFPSSHKAFASSGYNCWEDVAHGSVQCYQVVGPAGQDFIDYTSAFVSNPSRQTYPEWFRVVGPGGRVWAAGYWMMYPGSRGSVNDGIYQWVPDGYYCMQYYSLYGSDLHQWCDSVMEG